MFQLLKFVEPHLQEQFSKELNDYIESLKAHAILKKDPFELASLIINMTAKNFTVNKDDILNPNNKNRMVCDAKCCTAYLIGLTSNSPQWIAERLNVCRATVEHRKRMFSNMYETERMFKARVVNTVHDIEQEGFRFYTNFL